MTENPGFQVPEPRKTPDFGTSGVLGSLKVKPRNPGYQGTPEEVRSSPVSVSRTVPDFTLRDPLGSPDYPPRGQALASPGCQAPAPSPAPVRSAKFSALARWSCITAGVLVLAGADIAAHWLCWWAAL